MSDEEFIEPTAVEHPDLSHQNAQVRPGTVDPYRPEHEAPGIELESLREILLLVEHHFKIVTSPRSDARWPGLRGALLTWKATLEACIRNAHRGLDGIFLEQLRQICKYLGPHDGVSAGVRAEAHFVNEQPPRPATRGLDEVIADARLMVAHNVFHEITKLRCELEEWEAQLEANLINVEMTRPQYDAARAKLREVKALLGRSEPAKPRITERTYRALVDALQDLYEAQNGPPLATYTNIWNAAIRDADKALAAARAELSGEGVEANG